MACLKKIAQDLAFDCANPGLISGSSNNESRNKGIYRSIRKKLYSSDGGIAGKRQCSYYVGNISSHETSFIVTCS